MASGTSTQLLDTLYLRDHPHPGFYASLEEVEQIDPPPPHTHAVRRAWKEMTLNGVLYVDRSPVAYFKEVLEANPDVRWTFVVTHSPPHHSPTIGEKDPGNFPKIEALLGDRDYTVFSAHTHTYHYAERDGRDYITTSTSGAVNLPRPGAMDHVVWVTMTSDGPKIVNLLMNGIMDKKGPPVDDALEDIGLYHPRA